MIYVDGFIGNSLSCCATLPRYGVLVDCSPDVGVRPLSTGATWPASIEIEMPYRHPWRKLSTSPRQFRASDFIASTPSITYTKSASQLPKRLLLFCQEKQCP